MDRISCRIDLKMLKQNFSVLQHYAGRCRLMPVLKYDAYSLGAAPVAATLKQAGAFRFAVANVNEAVTLLKQGLEVQILGVLPDFEIPEAVAAGLICPVCRFDTARALSAEALRRKQMVKVAVKLDTGMHRLGFDPESELEKVIEIFKLPGLIPDSVFSHFSTASEPDVEYAEWQMKRFLDALETFSAAGLNFTHIHHAAGDAIINLPRSTQPPFNMARPGGIMYGSDFDSPCRQIITLSTVIGALKHLRPESDVGYLRTYRTAGDIPAAVLAAGYADGIPLALSNQGSVLIRGRHCPIIGRVSMDYTVVDISAVPDAAVGDEVILLGKQGSNSITVRQWGAMKQTHSHDIWCSIGHRVKRIYQE